MCASYTLALAVSLFEKYPFFIDVFVYKTYYLGDVISYAPNNLHRVIEYPKTK